ncbi:MAG: hypothetical protein ACREAC_32405, partial [Blastocatellia bacterium]
MKINWLKPAGDPVVNCQGRRRYRLIDLVVGKGAKQPSIAKELGDIPRVLNIYIFDGRVRIIEVERVLKV